MITRIFRVQIRPDLQTEFEPLFETVSVAAVERAEGFVSVEIGKPSKWAPHEYVMVSKWQSEAALIAFAGKEWHLPHIPDGMEKFVEQCWVHHYTN